MDCFYCQDTRLVRIDLPRHKWIPMKDGIYHQAGGDVHECVRGVSQVIRRPCPNCKGGAFRTFAADTAALLQQLYVFSVRRETVAMSESGAKLAVGMLERAQELCGLAAKAVSDMAQQADGRARELILACSREVTQRRAMHASLIATRAVTDAVVRDVEHDILPRLVENNADRIDAGRWRALFNSNLAWQGSGGFGHGDQLPDPSGYRHFGMSFTYEPTRESPRSAGMEETRVRCNVQGQAVLLEFVDAIVAREKEGTNDVEKQDGDYTTG